METVYMGKYCVNCKMSCIAVPTIFSPAFYCLYFIKVVGLAFSELSLNQFYSFLHEMEKAKASLEYFS